MIKSHEIYIVGEVEGYVILDETGEGVQLGRGGVICEDRINMILENRVDFISETEGVVCFQQLESIE